MQWGNALAIGGILVMAVATVIMACYTNEAMANQPTSQ